MNLMRRSCAADESLNQRHHLVDARVADVNPQPHSFNKARPSVDHPA
jgi:hypothetical protein